MTEKTQRGEEYVTGDQLTTEAYDLLAGFLLTGGLIWPAGMKLMGERKDHRLGGRPAAMGLWEDLQASSASQLLLLQELLTALPRAREATG